MIVLTYDMILEIQFFYLPYSAARAEMLKVHYWHRHANGTQTGNFLLLIINI
jgi:hypothetical protein